MVHDATEGWIYLECPPENGLGCGYIHDITGDVMAVCLSRFGEPSKMEVLLSIGLNADADKTFACLTIHKNVGHGHAVEAATIEGQNLLADDIMTREELLASPLIFLFWELANFVAENDKRVHAFLETGKQPARRRKKAGKKAKSKRRAA